MPWFAGSHAGRIALNPNAERLAIELEPTVRVSLRRRAVGVRGPNDYTWFGGTGTSISAILVVRDGRVAGTVETPAANYQLVPAQDGSTRIVRLRAGTPPELVVRKPLVPPPPRPRPDGPVVVQLLVAYTKAVSCARPDTQAFVQLLVDQLNAIGSNSGVRTRFVHRQLLVNEVEDLDLHNSAARLVDEKQAYMRPVRANRRNADLVILLQDATQGASTTGVSDNPRFEARYAYSVVHHAAADAYFTFAHEVGHQLGVLHEDDAQESHAHAHAVVEDKLATVGATCQSCRLTMHWSTPSKQIAYEGSMCPLGTESWNNSARAIDEMAPTVGAYRP